MRRKSVLVKSTLPGERREREDGSALVLLLTCSAPGRLQIGGPRLRLLQASLRTARVLAFLH